MTKPKTSGNLFDRRGDKHSLNAHPPDGAVTNLAIG
jgi:hypothetical protein